MALKVGLARCCRPSSSGQTHSRPAISPYRASDVFEVLLAQIGEFDPDLASDLIVGRQRDANAAGFCDALKPRCDVNAVSKDRQVSVSIEVFVQVGSVVVSCLDWMMVSPDR